MSPSALPIERVRATLRDEGAVLLPGLFPAPLRRIGKGTREYHPLRQSWTLHESRTDTSQISLRKRAVEGILGTRVRARLLAFRTGDFALRSDARGLSVVAVLDCSRHWDARWGGALGIGETRIPLAPGGLVLLKPTKDWFVTRVNHRARATRTLLVFTRR